jgi:hypothetical protein
MLQEYREKLMSEIQGLELELQQLEYDLNDIEREIDIIREAENGS